MKSWMNKLNGHSISHKELTQSNQHPRGQMQGKRKNVSTVKAEKLDHLWQGGCEVRRGWKSGWPLPSQSNIQGHKSWMWHVPSSEEKNPIILYPPSWTHVQGNKRSFPNMTDNKDSRIQTVFLNKLRGNEI